MAGAATAATAATFGALARSGWAVLSGPSPADPADILLTMVAALGFVLALWLGVGTVLSALAQLPGAVGLACERIAARVAPGAVRKATALLLGTTIAAAVAPGTAAAAPLTTPRHTVAASLVNPVSDTVTVPDPGLHPPRADDAGPDPGFRPPAPAAPPVNATLGALRCGHDPGGRVGRGPVRRPARRHPLGRRGPPSGSARVGSRDRARVAPMVCREPRGHRAQPPPHRAGPAPAPTGGSNRGGTAMTGAERLRIAPAPDPRPPIVSPDEAYRWRPTPYVQDALAIEFDEPDLPDQRTLRENLPDPEPFVARIAQAFVEVMAGIRPAPQVARWTTPAVYAVLTRRAFVAARRPPSAHRRAMVRRVRVQEPAPGAVEACAVVVHHDRVRALALRLTGLDQRWVVTDLQVG